MENRLALRNKPEQVRSALLADGAGSHLFDNAPNSDPSSSSDELSKADPALARLRE
jgi:hypothetical protein